MPGILVLLTLYCFHLFFATSKKNIIIVYMLRGHRTYLSLFQPEPVTDTITIPERKGRNEELIKQRNELLLHRHYFYSKIKCLQYHMLLEALESEFFITQRTLVDIVQTNSFILKDLNTKKPSAAYFKTKYPFLSWN